MGPSVLNVDLTPVKGELGGRTIGQKEPPTAVRSEKVSARQPGQRGAQSEDFLPEKSALDCKGQAVVLLLCVVLGWEQPREHGLRMNA